MNPSAVPWYAPTTDRAMQEIVKRPHYSATSRIIASTMAAEPNAEDFQQARAILAALLKHGYKVVPTDA